MLKHPTLDKLHALKLTSIAALRLDLRSPSTSLC